MQVVVDEEFGRGPAAPPHVEFCTGDVFDVVRMVRTTGETAPEFFWIKKDPRDMSAKDLVAAAVVLHPELSETRGLVELVSAVERPWLYQRGLVLPELSTLLSTIDHYFPGESATDTDVGARLTTVVGWITQYLQGGCIPSDLTCVAPHVLHMSSRVGYFSFEPSGSKYQSIRSQHDAAWAEVHWMYPSLRFGLMQGGTLTTYFHTPQYGLPAPTGFEARAHMLEAHGREDPANFALYRDTVEALRCRQGSESTL